MTNLTQETPAVKPPVKPTVKKASSNGLLDFLGYIPLLGSIIKAFRFGREKDLVLAILSIIVILGLIVFQFGYLAFLTIVIAATAGFLTLLIFMTNAKQI